MYFPGFSFGFPSGPNEPEEDDYQQEDGDQGQQGHQDYYELLGISSDAPPKQIYQKFQYLCSKHGPQGQQPDQQKLQKIKQAYEVLSDPQKRIMYNTTLHSHSNNQGNNLLNMMFGGQAPTAKKGKDLPKMQPTKKIFEVTLQDIYFGKTIDMAHQRSRLCQKCKGKGGQNVKKCPVCNGQGGMVKLVPVGPGMFTQVQQQCTNCKGLGDIFGEGGKCQQCEGNKITKKQVTLAVKVQEGISPGQIITLEGQGNQVPNAKPGDLLLVVQQKAHSQFTRRGADLFLQKHINLVQSLVGFNFKLDHINGKQYTVFTKPGQIIGDGCKKVLKGLGMPFFRDSQRFGNMIVEFKIDMPKRDELTPDQIKALSKSLPGKVNPRPEGHSYEMLQDFDKELLNTNEEGGKKEQDEEDMEQGGIGCRPQ